MNQVVCHISSVHPRFDVRIFHKQCVSLVKAGYAVKLLVADGKGEARINGVWIRDIGTNPVILNWACLAFLGSTHLFYGSLFICLTIALLLGAWELQTQKRCRHIPFMGLPAYFVAMLTASIAAFANYLKGKNYGVWEKNR